ncbi:magnesium-chelatase 60 kDa subunit [Roseobacter cerasinus]|uniref:Magnesium-chelatase 60 kDa subunit n=1 Tax=Roseobacter cerasinus TaxID=2602289 RepID=A0A640VPS2_9RHOB|nr:magnesium chelatase subunit D [Roseobacter cerasinus]GFE49450.1 magnesium-chelatase 60 kDa subunit [Roseobacter cerasinus]
MSRDADSWALTATCLSLLRAAPDYLGGAVIRMRAGPDRDAVLAGMAPLPLRKIHPGISDDQLLGGLDLTATLSTGRLAQRPGLFDAPCMALLTMAERCETELAAKLAHQLDREFGHCLIALDEGAEPDECVPAALADRLPFYISPEGRRPEGWSADNAGADTCDPGQVSATLEDAQTLTVIAAQFGIASLRAPLLALRAARVHAAVNGRTAVDRMDLEVAARLVYPHRATKVPDETEPPADTPEPPPQEEQQDATGDGLSLPEGDMIVDAVKALLPADVLAGLGQSGAGASRAGTGAGQKRVGNRRGRPLSPRPGRLDGRARIDLVATLRAAAPWQPLRRQQQQMADRLLIRPSDIRVKRYQDHSDRLLVFAVDASGSAALARLNEAKGAVELLLAQAYAARDHVALIAFRGTGADILLPPTRSLVQTKRRLATLPGGGGTPLAAGLQAASLLALQNRAKGLTPSLIVLTDGRANIALDGEGDRSRAGQDAKQVARLIQTQGLHSLLIDTGTRPHTGLRDLAACMGGTYLALPRADAQRLTTAVSAALDS